MLSIRFDDDQLELAARDYMRMLPGTVAVPMRYTKHDGWVPMHPDHFELAERAGHDVESNRYPFILVSGQRIARDAIVFAPELVDRYPAPTFAQYLEMIDQRRQRALSFSRTMAAAFDDKPSRPAPRR